MEIAFDQSITFHKVLTEKWQSMTIFKIVYNKYVWVLLTRPNKAKINFSEKKKACLRSEKIRRKR